ncbi:hypothetical protein [Roseateles sp. P5_E7]
MPSKANLAPESPTLYDADRPPNGAAWLALPDAEKLRLVVSFHAANRQASGRHKSHAAMHVVLEDRVARGDGPVVRALARLQQQGQARHDALHAVGEVMARHLRRLDAPRDGPDASAWQRQLNEALERLSATPASGS